MRNAFIEHLISLFENDESLFLVVGDLGYTVVDPLVEKYPDRFLNVGVAEQNMTAVASGLAKEGYKVFTYSIANFTTLRCLEQIRNDICYHDLPVCVVSVGGGFMYGYLGPTHHATEDIGILRTLPRMRVFVPFSCDSARCALDEVVASPGPAYIRLGREGLDVAGVTHNGLFRVKAHSQASRAEAAVLCVGKISPEVVALAEQRKADLWAICRVKPLPEADIARLVADYQDLLVVEDHQRQGGVLSAIAESTTRLRGINLRDTFASVIDGEDGIRRHMLFQQTEARNEEHCS